MTLLDHPVDAGRPGRAQHKEVDEEGDDAACNHVQDCERAKFQEATFTHEIPPCASGRGAPHQLADPRPVEQDEDVDHDGDANEDPRSPHDELVLDPLFVSENPSIPLRNQIVHNDYLRQLHRCVSRIGPLTPKDERAHESIRTKEHNHYTTT